MLKSILHPAHEARSVLVKKKDSLSWTTNPDQHVGKSQQTNYCAITAPHSLASMYSIHHTSLLINTQVYLHLNASKCHTRKWQNKTNPSICKKQKHKRLQPDHDSTLFLSIFTAVSMKSITDYHIYIFCKLYTQSETRQGVHVCECTCLCDGMCALMYTS